MFSSRVPFRHVLLSVAFLILFLLLNRPEVIVISRLGAVVWYPATGLTLALLLGISPWYGCLAVVSDALAGTLIYGQPLATFSQTVGAIGIAAAYAAAAYILRGPLKIDLRLHRRRDVVLYVFVTTLAAIVCTGLGVLCLAADHAIRWNEFWQSTGIWFLGDEIGLLGVAPFLLIHVLPWVRRQLSQDRFGLRSQKKRLAKKSSSFWTLVELGGQICALFLSLWTLFGSPFLQFQLLFLTFVPIIWVAMRQGIRRVVSGLLALNFGIVVALRLSPPAPGLLPKYGLLMFVVSATGLIVGSAVTERHRLAVELLARTAELTDANTEMIAAKCKAEEASRIKGEFLANMSHEIRTPVNGILGMTELMLQTELSREQRDYLAMLKSSGHSLLSVIDDILDFSKVESGKLELDPVEFNLRDTMEETLRTLALRSQEKGLELACDVCPSISENVIGDSGRLRQVLVNLIGNAIKFTHQGEVIVRVQVESCGSDNVGLHFSVADTGIGIPPAKQSLIFEAFAQADGSTTREYGGTGLGLAICSRLVGLMGGRIWVESTVGTGSAFHFTGNFKIADTQGNVKVSSHSIDLANLPVLVVDDNASNREILLRIAKNWGLNAIATESGRSALEAIELAEARGAGFRLAIVDSRMPGMDGFEFAKRLEQNPRLAGAIIMMIASAERGDVERCREMGVAAYVLKPIRQSELLASILTVLGETSSSGTVSGSNVTAGKFSKQLRILVAEDNPVNQRVVVRMLEKMGHSAEIACNGQEALSTLQSSTFDLVLMDVQMPQMDGLTASRKIREEEKQTGAHIPIIAMTAHAMKGDKERCLEAGMDGYMSKPVNSQQIADTIIGTLTAESRPPLLPTTPASSLPWDRAKALDRVDGDEHLLLELEEIFLHECPGQLATLEQAIKGANLEEIERIAHRLKGELGYLGLPDAAQRARELEQSGYDRNLRAAAERFPALQSKLFAVVAAMQDDLEKHSQQSA